MLVLTSLAATFYIVFLRPAPTRETIQRHPPAPRPVTKPSAAPASKQPRREELDVPVLAPPEVKTAITESLPRLAIIIDDLGYRRRLGGEFLALKLDLSYSFLPHAPFTLELAGRAAGLGRDVLLHLPLEPTDSRWDPGPGALTLAMSGKALQRGFARDLAAVPGAIGVNNHMGSKFTRDERAMTSLLKEIGKRDLFFVDSLTAADSVGFRIARAQGIKTGRRQVFLDNIRQVDSIKKQLKTLVEQAEKHGQAIGIGHPHPETLTALREFAAHLSDRVLVVGVHELTD